MKLLLSPHNDDESLFAAYTIMREQPLVLVVADCNIQFNLGWGITAEQRKEESRQGCKILGVDVDFLGLPEDAIDRENLVSALRPFKDFELVFAPAIQRGNATRPSWRGCFRIFPERPILLDIHSRQPHPCRTAGYHAHTGTD